MNSSTPTWGVGTAVIALLGEFMLGGLIYFGIMKLIISVFRKSRKNLDIRKFLESKLVEGGIGIFHSACTILLVYWLVSVWHGENFFQAMHFIYTKWYWIVGAIIFGICFVLVRIFTDIALEKVSPSPNVGKSSIAVILIWESYNSIMRPLSEELIFRGLLYPALVHQMNVLAAIVITATVFSAMHTLRYGIRLYPLIWFFIMGLILTWLREVSNSIWPSFVMHVVLNILFSFTQPSLNKTAFSMYIGHNDKGVALYNSRNYEKAYSEFEQALKLIHTSDSRRNVTMLNLGNTCSMLGRYYEATMYYQRVLYSDLADQDMKNKAQVALTNLATKQ